MLKIDVVVEKARLGSSPGLPPALESHLGTLFKGAAEDAGIVTTESLRQLVVDEVEKLTAVVENVGVCDVVAPTSQILAAFLEGLELRLRIRVDSREVLRVRGGDQ